ncbi:conserved hypothetical protein (plasmid) [Haloquadratum walsbyi C23]|uniref:Uncharacterized protein n=2 Tax=Haloquadratum walsbyi TaxID=293091 RepID=G0LNG2_HALWC|nr:conserved hypothetical protein [Haloquadratum walsbyi C23]
MTDFDHTDIEKQLIKDFGGTPSESFGPDGMIGDEPTEVRLAKKEDRFRLNKDTHETLVENDGTYIFDDLQDNQPPKQVEADQVADELGEDWHSDRGYMHQFVSVDSFF